MSTDKKMNTTLLDRLLTKREDELTEFKEAKTNFDIDKLGKYTSALANEANMKRAKKAWLILGVADDKQVVGTTFKNRGKELQKLSERIANETNNRFTFAHIHELYDANKKRVLAFEIMPAPPAMPIAYKGHYYGREGESLQALSIGELEYIRAQQKPDWAMHTVAKASITDLDPDALAMARKQFGVKNPRLKEDIPQWTDIEFLHKAKLAVDNKLTRGYLLLLGTAESSHFLSPVDATITWILRDRDNIEQDYEHFKPPFLLAVDGLFHKIRNLKYRYMPFGTLFPEEVERYDPYIIREALANCIVHQDYHVGAKITVVESDNHTLIFKNKGEFLPKTIEKVLFSDTPETYYKNAQLAEQMRSLNMIDTVGSGIKKMYKIQKNKYFPLPDYSFDNDTVTVKITGKVLDVNYAIKLAEMPELSLNDIFLLDKVHKNELITDYQAKDLRQRQLIEGRKPHYHVSKQVAQITEETVNYQKRKGIDDVYCRDMILRLLEMGNANRTQIEELLLDKLPDSLTIEQRKDRVKNNLQWLRRNQKIQVSEGRSWEITDIGLQTLKAKS